MRLRTTSRVGVVLAVGGFLLGCSSATHNLGGGTGGQAGAGASGGAAGAGGDAACVQAGGTVSTSLCCQSAGDFPNTCAIGACGCPPQNSHTVQTCVCPSGKCFNGTSCQ